MTKPRMMDIKLPFEGFYESWYSQEMDHIEEREAEYFEERQSGEDAIPPELRIDGQRYCEILTDCCDYRAAELSICKMYVDAFDYWASETLGEDAGKSLDKWNKRLGLVFDEMVSPREYNFGTDRLFAKLRASTVRKLFAINKADYFKSFAAVLKERHTSYDGFCSFYKNDVASWLDKPLLTWDHNEVESLLQAALLVKGADHDWKATIFDMVSEDDGIYQAWSEAVDWAKVDAKVAELREELAEEYRADHDPDYVPPAVRCPLTPDLFDKRT